MGVLYLFHVFCTVLEVLSCFAIILTVKIELVALHCLPGSFDSIDLWLFLVVPWAGLQCVIDVFPDRTHFRF